MGWTPTKSSHETSKDNYPSRCNESGQTGHWCGETGKEGVGDGWDPRRLRGIDPVPVQLLEHDSEGLEAPLEQAVDHHARSQHHPLLAHSAWIFYLLVAFCLRLFLRSEYYFGYGAVFIFHFCCFLLIFTGSTPSFNESFYLKNSAIFI